MSTCRVAVVGGAGTWGRYYLNAFDSHPDCRVVGLVEKPGKRRDIFASHYAINNVYDSVDDLLQVEVPDIVSAVVPVSVNPYIVQA